MGRLPTQTQAIKCFGNYGELTRRVNEILGRSRPVPVQTVSKVDRNIIASHAISEAIQKAIACFVAADPHAGCTVRLDGPNTEIVS